MNTTDLLNTKEVAELLKLSAPRIRQLAQKGILPAKHIGRDWVFIRAEVEGFSDTPRRAGRPGRPKHTKLLDNALHEVDLWRNRAISLQAVIDCLYGDGLISRRVGLLKKQGWYVGVVIDESAPTEATP